MISKAHSRLVSFSLMMTLAATPLCAHAATNETGIILSNCESAQKNATNYQWHRVNLEVARVAAATGSLLDSPTVSPKAARAIELRSAVDALRAAQTNRDIVGVQTSTGRITKVLSP